VLLLLLLLVLVLWVVRVRLRQSHQLATHDTRSSSSICVMG
jgi:hypothetical protein